MFQLISFVKVRFSETTSIHKTFFRPNQDLNIYVQYQHLPDVKLDKILNELSIV